MSTRKPKHKDYSVLDDARDHVATALGKNGISQDIAERAADFVREHLRAHWGGQMIYFTKDLGEGKEARNIAIYRKWNGNNMDELMEEYRLSMNQIYRCIRLGAEALRRQAKQEP